MFLLIIFAAEVAAGIWGLSNEEKVGDVHSPESQVTFIYIVQIVSKQLHRNKKEDGSVVKFQQY